MLPLKSFLCALLVLFSFCAAACGQGKDKPNLVADIDPFPAWNAAFWQKAGAKTTFPLLDGNKDYQVFETQKVLARSVAGVNHDVDSKGVGHSHWHYQDDYPAAKNQYNTDYTGQANDYWDVVFQKGLQGDSDRFQDAYTQGNCFSYALDSYIGKSSYKYWLDDINAMNGTPGSLMAAFLADATPFPKANVAQDDVLIYNTKPQGPNGVNTHASCVRTINCGPPRTPGRLNWKFGGSGLYLFTSNSFDTPMNVFQDPAPGKPLPAVNWQTDGAGSDAQLYPLVNDPANPGQKTGAVWR